MSQVPPEVSGADAWPFCIGANRAAGQAVIMAPPWLIATERAFLLFLVTGAAEQHAGSAAKAAEVGSAEGQGAGQLWGCRVTDEVVGEFTAVFVARRVTPEMVGESGETLHDSASRPVYFFAGVAMRDAQGGAPSATPRATLDQAVSVATAELSAFWKADSKFVDVKPSTPIHPISRRPAADPITELDPIIYPRAKTSAQPLDQTKPAKPTQPRSSQEPLPESEPASTDHQPAGTRSEQGKPGSCRPRATGFVLAIVIVAIVVLVIYLLVRG